VIPGPTPESGQAAQEDTYPLGLSSDADDRPSLRHEHVSVKTVCEDMHKPRKTWFVWPLWL